MAQADSALITIPTVALPPTVFYIPEIRHSSRSGSYFPELNKSDTTKATIVADMATAQHEDVCRVIGFDLVAGTSWDASKEIAHAVLDVVLVDHIRVPGWCVDFLEEHLGVGFVRQCEREAA